MASRLRPNGPPRPPGPLYERVLNVLIFLLLLGSLVLAGANRVTYGLIALASSFSLLLLRGMVRRIRGRPLDDGHGGLVDPPHQDPSIEYQPPDPD